MGVVGVSGRECASDPENTQGDHRRTKGVQEGASSPRHPASAKQQGDADYDEWHTGRGKPPLAVSRKEDIEDDFVMRRVDRCHGLSRATSRLVTGILPVGLTQPGLEQDPEPYG